VLSLFTRTRGRSSALRPHRARPAVERLEGRDAPSSLDVTSLTSPTDSTGTTTTAVLSPAPGPVTPTDPTTTVVPLAITAPALLPAPDAGDTLPAPAPAPTVPVLSLGTPAEVSDWTYSVSGTVTDPNPSSLTIKITVDGVAEPSAKVTPVLNPDGTPSGKGKFTATFGLPECTSATESTHYGTAVATDGTRFSPKVIFTIDQNPVTGSTLGTL
jgi:hypothetical protein